MSNNVSVNFKVSGSELSAYMDQIQRKSESITNSAIRGAREQTDKAKEQLKIINDTIAALEKKQRLEAMAQRSILQERRDQTLKTVRDQFEGEKNTLYSRTDISDKDLKERITAIEARQKNAEDKVNGGYGEQLQILKEQEKQQKIAVSQSKESIKDAKIIAEEQRREIRKGNTTLEQVREVAEAGGEEAKLTANILEEQLQDEKRKEERDKKREGKDQEKENVFGALLKTDLIRQAGGMIGQIPNARNELDFIKPMTSLIGMALAGGVGTLIDGVVSGVTMGAVKTQTAVIGAEMGKIAGEFVGSSLERAYRGREDLTNKNFALQALTGNNYGVDALGGANGLGGTGKSSLTGNLSRYGFDYSQTADLQLQLAQRQGYAKNLQGGAENLVALEKGLGVNREATFQIVDIQRSAAKENRDFLRTISGIYNAGKGGMFKDDRTFLPEFLGRFATLSRELLKTQGQVATGSVMDILSRFDSIGGQFSMRDPRSMGLVQSFNNSLINPSTDFKKALSYQVLRRKMGSGASMADIIQEQQKGAASDIYSSGMMELYATMGDDDSKRFNFADFFDGNVEAGTKALRGYQSGKLKTGNLFGKQLSGGMSEGDMRSLAERQVGKYTKSTAEIQNMFVDDVSKAVSGVGEKMEELFGNMITELKSFIVNKIKNNDTNIIQNTKSKPSSAHR